MVKWRLETVLVPEAHVEELDRLVKDGKYSSRAGAIRVAIYRLTKKEKILAEERRRKRQSWSNYELQ